MISPRVCLCIDVKNWLCIQLLMLLTHLGNFSLFYFFSWKSRRQCGTLFTVKKHFRLLHFFIRSSCEKIFKIDAFSRGVWALKVVQWNPNRNLSIWHSICSTDRQLSSILWHGMNTKDGDVSIQFNHHTHDHESRPCDSFPNYCHKYTYGWTCTWMTMINSIDWKWDPI